MKLATCTDFFFFNTRFTIDAGKYWEYIIFIIPSCRFFSKLNMFNVNDTPIIIDEIGKVKNQQAYTVVILKPKPAHYSFNDVPQHSRYSSDIHYSLYLINGCKSECYKKQFYTPKTNTVV